MVNCSPGYIKIGCKIETLETWLKTYKAVGRVNGYTPEQIKEYYEYIKLFAKLMR